MRAGVGQWLQRFLRGIYADSITMVEHAGTARGQFALMRSVRQGCPASGCLFVYHGLCPELQVAHVSCPAARSSPTVVYAKMFLGLRRRLCYRYGLFAKRLWASVSLRRLPGYFAGIGPPCWLWEQSEICSFPVSSEVDAKGLLIRSPEALRSLTLCNCDCEVINAAMCSGLRRYAIECVHPSQDV